MSAMTKAEIAAMRRKYNDMKRNIGNKGTINNRAKRDVFPATLLILGESSFQKNNAPMQYYAMILKDKMIPYEKTKVLREVKDGEHDVERDVRDVLGQVDKEKKITKLRYAFREGDVFGFWNSAAVKDLVPGTIVHADIDPGAKRDDSDRGFGGKSRVPTHEIRWGPGIETVRSRIPAPTDMLMKFAQGRNLIPHALSTKAAYYMQWLEEHPDAGEKAKKGAGYREDNQYLLVLGDKELLDDITLQDHSTFTFVDTGKHQNYRTKANEPLINYEFEVTSWKGMWSPENCALARLTFTVFANNGAICGMVNGMHWAALMASSSNDALITHYPMIFSGVENCERSLAYDNTKHRARDAIDADDLEFVNEPFVDEESGNNNYRFKMELSTRSALCDDFGFLRKVGIPVSAKAIRDYWGSSRSPIGSLSNGGGLRLNPSAELICLSETEGDLSSVLDAKDKYEFRALVNVTFVDTKKCNYRDFGNLDVEEGDALLDYFAECGFKNHMSPSEYCEIHADTLPANSIVKRCQFSVVPPPSVDDQPTLDQANCIFFFAVNIAETREKRTEFKKKVDELTKKIAFEFDMGEDPWAPLDFKIPGGGIKRSRGATNGDDGASGTKRPRTESDDDSDLPSDSE